jgi:uncharacterized protein
MTDEDIPADDSYEETAAEDRNDGGTTSEERTLAMLSHVSPPALSLLTGGGLCWLVPLIIWLVKKDDSQFVGEEAKEALNLQLTLFLAFLVSWVLVLVCIGIPMLVVLWLYGLIYGIIAGMAAYEGKPYRYPWALRLIQ